MMLSKNPKKAIDELFNQQLEQIKLIESLQGQIADLIDICDRQQDQIERIVEALRPR
jgi:uncharacterized coiled-coil protein SlyX